MAMLRVKTSIKTNFVLQSIWQILLILTPLVTTPYLSRVLGAEKIGFYSYTSSIASYFVMFATLGMSTYGVREIAICSTDRRRRSIVFSEAFASQLCVSAIVLVVYVGYVLFIPQVDVIVSLSWLFWILSAMIDCSWLFFGVEEFLFPTVASITSKFLSVVAIFLFVKSEDDLWIYCLSISISYFLNQAILLLRIGGLVDICKPSRKMIARRFVQNIKLFIPVVAISLYSTLDKVMLGSMTSMSQTGYFEYSEKLARMPLSIVTAMGTVMLPRMSSALDRGEKHNALDMLGNSIWLMLLLSFAMMFGIIAISRDFAPIFLGEDFASCDVLMQILSLIIPLVSTTNVLGRQYLIPSKHDALYTFSVVVGAIVNIASNLILIPRLEATGAAISTVLAEFSVLVTQVLITRNELPLRNYLNRSLPFFVIGMVMMFAVSFVSHTGLRLFGSSPLLLGVEIATGVLSYTGITVIWCVITKNKYFLRLIKR